MARRRERPVNRSRAVRRRSRIPEYKAGSSELLQTSVADGLFVKSIEITDRNTETARNNKGKIHASSLLYDFCPRRFALANIPKYSSPMSGSQPTSNDRLVWAIGRAVEAHIRKNLIASLGRKRFIGKWKCLCGSNTHRGQFEVGLTCKLCNSAIDVYDEYTVDFEGIIGNPDMIFIDSGGILHIIEIKSKKKAGKDGFDELTKAEVLHILQACIYRRLVKLEGYEVADHVTILYGCKDYAFKGSPYREYRVLASDYDKLIDNYFARGKEGLNAVLKPSNPLPPRLESCSHPETPRSKKCDACAMCFNLKR